MPACRDFADLRTGSKNSGHNHENHGKQRKRKGFGFELFSPFDGGQVEFVVENSLANSFSGSDKIKKHPAVRDQASECCDQAKKRVQREIILPRKINRCAKQTQRECGEE